MGRLVETNTITLEAIELAVHKQLSQEGWQGLKLRADNMMDLVSGQMTLSLRATIMGRTNQEFNISYPQDWWQACKDRWFPAWAKARWPVRRTYHSVKVQELYPTVAVPAWNPKLVIWKTEGLSLDWPEDTYAD